MDCDRSFREREREREIGIDKVPDTTKRLDSGEGSTLDVLRKRLQVPKWMMSQEAADRRT